MYLNTWFHVSFMFAALSEWFYLKLGHQDSKNISCSSLFYCKWHVMLLGVHLLISYLPTIPESSPRPPRPLSMVGGGARQWHPQLLLLREQKRGGWQWSKFLGRCPTYPGNLWIIPRSPRTLRRTTAPLDNVPKYFVTSTLSRIILKVMVVRRWTLFQIFLFAALLFQRWSSLRRFWNEFK